MKTLALQHNLPLATGNTRHFQYIQEVGHNLRLENWRETSVYES
jgi:predicted nucleic acid-binding protein